MNLAEETKGRLERALQKVERHDQYLLEYDLHEQCIAGRLAMYLQAEFPNFFVDVEYDRDGDDPKMLGLPTECANKTGRVRPDIVIHCRGKDGPNLLVLELKKAGHSDPRQCVSKRIDAFRSKFRYAFGASIMCEIGAGQNRLTFEWFDDASFP